MSAKKRYINTIFWRDNYIANLDPSEKLLFLYLITNPDTNILGVYQIPMRQMSIDTGFDKEMVNKILSRFQKDNKVLYYDGWIAIKNFVKHQNYKSPFIQTSIENEFENIPEEIKIWLKDGIETVLNKHIYISKSKDKSIGKDIAEKNKIPPTLEMVKRYCEERNNKIWPLLESRYFIENEIQLTAPSQKSWIIKVFRPKVS